LALNTNQSINQAILIKSSVVKKYKMYLGIDWCLMPILAVFQLYRGIMKIGISIFSSLHINTFLLNNVCYFLTK
jgi:hypothetical protein